MLGIKICLIMFNLIKLYPRIFGDSPLIIGPMLNI